MKLDDYISKKDFDKMAQTLVDIRNDNQEIIEFEVLIADHLKKCEDCRKAYFPKMEEAMMIIVHHLKALNRMEKE